MKNGEVLKWILIAIVVIIIIRTVAVIYLANKISIDQLNQPEVINE